MTQRFHLFPFRTQKLSSVVPKILGWRRPGKIGRRRLFSSLYSYMARWSSGQDGGLSRRKREFDSPTGHHVGMDYISFKKPSRMAGLFSYHFVIPPFPHKTLQGKLLRGPCCRGETNAPAEWTAFHSKTQTIGWAFFTPFRLFFPIKLCKANFCGGPAAGKKMSCFSYYSTISTSHKLRKKQRLVFI